MSERQASHTKRGPGRKAHCSHNPKAPRTMVPPLPRKLQGNVGRNVLLTYHGVQFWTPASQRRVWREGEPVHIAKPVRAARIAAEKARREAA